MPPTTTSWRALGTSVHVLVTDEALSAPAVAAVAAVLDEVDRTYSRFRPDSELSRLNGHPGEWRRVTPLLGEAIGAALDAARLTDGAVDPTVGRSMRLIGYDEDFSRLAGREATDAPEGPRARVELRIEPIPGWRAIRFDVLSRNVLLPLGVELDLGSTGKALAADLAAAAAYQAMGRGGVLVSLGGDIAIVGDVPAGGWRVLAGEDSDAPPESAGEVIGLSVGALATSSTTVRRWTRGGITLHHIVDPATGLPAQGPWRTATVVADRCVDANAAATAAIVKGSGAMEWLTRLGLPSRLVSTSGEVWRIAGWPSPEEGEVPA